MEQRFYPAMDYARRFGVLVLHGERLDRPQDDTFLVHQAGCVIGSLSHNVGRVAYAATYEDFTDALAVSIDRARYEQRRLESAIRNVTANLMVLEKELLGKRRGDVP